MTDTDPHELAPESLPAKTEDDTGPIRDAADVRLYLELDAMQARLGEIARYVRGRIDGHEVDLAQSKAFEQRISAAVQYISRQNDRLSEQQQTIIGMLAKLGDDMMEVAHKVVTLQEKVRHLSIARCEDCPSREAEAL